MSTSDPFRRCADCSALPPPTETAHTLIGASHGWRLIVRKLAGGDVVREWRCPSCWAERKKSNPQGPPTRTRGGMGGGAGR